jgi:hypothetical protein
MDIDWRSLLLKYARAVVDDDYIVGLRCLEPMYGAWSAEEQEVMIEVHRDLWPADFLGPWSEGKYDRDLRPPCDRL